MEVIMTIFSPEDVQDVILERERVLGQKREDYFEYFCDEAVAFFTKHISDRKEELLAGMRAEAGRTKKTVSVNLWEGKTYHARSSYGRKVRREMENESRGTGAWFESPTGIHRANLYALFKHSQFVHKLDEAVGGGVYILMLQRCTGRVCGVDIYEIILTINLDLQ